MAKNQGNKEVVVALTREDVEGLITAAIEGLASREALQVLVTGQELEDKVAGLITRETMETSAKQLLQGAVTEERVVELLLEMAAQFFPNKGTSLPSALASEKTSQHPLDPAWLDGLTFCDASLAREVVEGRPRIVATKEIRELRPADVLAYRVTDSQVFLSTADGKKHTVDI